METYKSTNQEIEVSLKANSLNLFELRFLRFVLSGVVVFGLAGCDKTAIEKAKNQVRLKQASLAEDQKLTFAELDKKYSVLLGQVVKFKGEPANQSEIGIISLLVYPAGSMTEQDLQMPLCESKARELRIQNIRAVCLRSSTVAKIFRPFDPQPPYSVIPVQP